ncbi:hypothetical protein OOK58_59165 [Streptomyces sp. NBC_01728]|uniref:hypothetical protein n=1 Tax=unclassified Streptomyces TaxID=2593676 RepID=UPI0022590498|nr:MULTISPECIES: hypothetical protein [unclassified Streptomyces]MCX4462431.1 hypothetical protein [Streptomyces sp. NBC_01719]MCX4500861.1 hypothetical protein [Streptomyces sp. NBC_01728]
MAETSSWNRGGPQPPAQPTAAQALPPRVARSRSELEKLRDDARASQPLQPGDVRMIWCSPDGVASALEAIIHTTRWLLGEREWAPISRAMYEYPDLPVPLIRTHAEDAIFGYKWADTSEWYAGGVKRTVEWATSTDEERPIFE